MQRNGGSGSLQTSQEEYDVSYKVRIDEIFQPKKRKNLKCLKNK